MFLLQSSATSKFANGQSRFLLARLHLESLADKMSPGLLQMALKSLPAGAEALSTAYERIMQRIWVQTPGIKSFAQKALGWIAQAKRLLSVVELRYALAIQPGASDFNADFLCDISAILLACRGLVIVDQGRNTNTVRLVHSSTHEFFKRCGNEYFPDAQQDIATGCLTYLLYDIFKEGWQVDPTGDQFQWELFQGRVQRYPLLPYAAQHWAIHAKTCSEQPVGDLMIRFLEDEYKVSSATEVILSPLLVTKYTDWYHGNCAKLYYGLSSQAGNRVSGMHLAAYYGIRNVVSMLLDIGCTADIRDPWNSSPLFWAALMGHVAIVELLLSLNEVSLDLSTNRDPNSSALEAAANRNHRVRQLVLPQVLDFQTEDVPGGASPISQATGNGNRIPLKSPLMMNFVDVNSQDKDGDTPLTVAAGRGHDEVVLQLLNQVNISPDLASKKGITPLVCAASRGYVAVVRILVARADIDVNSTSFHGEAPLSLAIWNDHQAVVETLLAQTNIDVNVTDWKGWTPLMVAASGNHENIAGLLLAHHRIDVNHKDNYGRNVLSIAAISGNRTMVKSLLRCNGIDLNSTDNNGHTCLSQAAFGWLEEDLDFAGLKLNADEAFEEHEAIVKLLLERTDLNMECPDVSASSRTSRLTELIQEASEPRLESVIAVLQNALENRWK